MSGIEQEEVVTIADPPMDEIAAPLPVIAYETTGTLPSFRWTVCALLFAATTINYMDRQILGLLAPSLQKEIGWTEAHYGHIVVAFQAAYAIGLICVGRTIDKIGTRTGYAWAILIWSLAAAAHALARSATGFGVARFALGLGEAGNFPAAIKTVAEWFPKRERAFATGLFNTGSNIGAIIAPLLVPAMAAAYGWRGAFVITGAAGLIWLVVWLLLYSSPETSKRVTAEQLAALRADDSPADLGADHSPVRWSTILKLPQTWGLVLQGMCVQPVWWFYLFWLPKFFTKQYGLTISESGGLLAIVYGLSLSGSIGGGALPAFFLKQGYSLNFSRKTTLFICVLLAIPMSLVSGIGNPWIATVVIGFAAAALQGWAANTYTLTSDLFPKRAIATVVGFGSACGSVSAIAFAEIIGNTLQKTGSYTIPFVLAGISLPAAWLFIQCFSPRLEPARI